MDEDTQDTSQPAKGEWPAVGDRVVLVDGWSVDGSMVFTTVARVLPTVWVMEDGTRVSRRRRKGPDIVRPDDRWMLRLVASKAWKAFQFEVYRLERERWYRQVAGAEWQATLTAGTLAGLTRMVVAPRASEPGDAKVAERVRAAVAALVVAAGGPAELNWGPWDPGPR